MSRFELTEFEEKELARCEKQIETGTSLELDGAEMVGQALGVIRDQKLYKKNHPNFETYIKARYGFSRGWAYGHIRAFEKKKALCSTKEGKLLPGKTLTTNSHLEELANVPEEHFDKVVEQVIEESKHGKVTAAQIKRMGRDLVKADVQETARKHREAQVYSESSDIENALRNGKELGSILYALRQVKASVNKVKPDLGTDEFATRRTAIMMHLDAASEAINNTIPYKACPFCNGEKCARCNNYGWVNKRTYNILIDQKENGEEFDF